MIFSSFAIFSLALSPSGISGIEFSEQVWYGEEIAVRIPLSPLFYLAPQAFLVVFAVLLRCQCSEDVISKVAIGWEEATVGTEGPILWRHRRADFTFHIFCEAISHFVKIENSVGDDAVNLPYNSFIKSLVDVGGFSHGM